MSDVESGTPRPEAVNKIVLIRPDNQVVELRGANQDGVDFLGGVRTTLIAAINSGFVEATPFSIAKLAKQDSASSPAASELTLADLKTPDHFRDYFTHKLGAFLGQQVSLSLPSQEYVDRGNRIKDAGFTTYEPVVFPTLALKQEFVYPANWQLPLDPWVYEQIAEKNLKPNVLSLRELWCWLDTSVRLDWTQNSPMFDENMDKPLADLLSSLRAKGEREGIVVPRYVEYLDRDLDPRSAFGVSADETRTVVYPSLAEMFGVKRGEVRDLTAAEFNFVGNLSYPHLSEANSWEWLNDNFGDRRRLIGGGRGHDGYGGLSCIYYCLSGNHNDGIRFRPLVVS